MIEGQIHIVRPPTVVFDFVADDEMSVCSTRGCLR